MVRVTPRPLIIFFTFCKKNIYNRTKFAGSASNKVKFAVPKTVEGFIEAVSYHLGHNLEIYLIFLVTQLFTIFFSINIMDKKLYGKQGGLPF